MECHVGDFSNMSGAQKAVEQPAEKRKRKVPQVFAEADFPGSYDRRKEETNTETGQKMLEAAQGQRYKKPNFSVFHAELERISRIGQKG